MKTREIPSYASNHIPHASQAASVSPGYVFESTGGANSVTQHISSSVNPEEVSQQVSAIFN